MGQKQIGSKGSARASSLPRLLSHLAIVWKGGKRGTGPSLSNSNTWPVSRAPPAFLPYLEGTQNRFTARPRSGPGPRGSSPSRATSARPNRYRRPPLIPGPDQGSREGGDVDYGGGRRGGEKISALSTRKSEDFFGGSARSPEFRGSAWRGRAKKFQVRGEAIHELEEAPGYSARGDAGPDQSMAASALARPLSGAESVTGRSAA